MINKISTLSFHDSCRQKLEKQPPTKLAPLLTPLKILSYFASCTIPCIKV